MKTIDMTQYGLYDSLSAEAAQYENCYIGRIISQEKGLYRVITEGGELIAEIAGKLRFEVKTPSEFPAVGDFVLLDRINDIHGYGIMSKVLARKSLFIRKAAGKTSEEQAIAANIDTALICMSLNNDFNIHRLERYLSLAWESGATPIVVLTKADLCDDIEAKRSAVETVALGVDILVTTAMAEDGYQKMMQYCKPGMTATFIGSSGVGKSTLINRLMNQEYLLTNSLRNDDKGRHTTTRRELILLPNGGMVIDTPGMRELGMIDISDGLNKGFHDIEALFDGCRFRNCSHTTEPGCAVQAAIERGDLSQKRFESYQKLKVEAAFSGDKNAYMTEKEKRFKSIAKINKSNHKK
mgnify:CR=1 FL=1